MKTESVPHPKWVRTNMFAHSVVSWAVKQSSCTFNVTIAGFPVLDSASDWPWILMLLQAFAKSYIPNMPKCCMRTFGNGRNNTKTACICLYRVWFPICIGIPGAIFNAHVNIRQTSSVVMPGFRQTVLALRRSWLSWLFDCFPGPFNIMPLSIAGP